MGCCQNVSIKNKINEIEPIMWGKRRNKFRLFQ